MNYRDDIAKMRLAKHDAAQMTIFHNWIKEHPEFDYTSAKNFIQSYYNGDDWTFENLSESAQRLVEKGIIKPLRLSVKTRADFLEDENEERKELVDYILSNRTYTPEARRSERVRFMNAKTVNIKTLREIKQNILEARRLSASSKDELIGEARDNVAQAQASRGVRQGQYLPIPELYKNRSMLISLASENLNEFKRLMQRCDPAEIQSILNQVEE